MTKIKTQHSHECGKSRSTSFGEISFDEQGIADVPQDVAEKLTEVSPSLSIVQEQSLEETETPTPTPTPTPSGLLGVIQTTEVTKEEIVTPFESTIQQTVDDSLNQEKVVEEVLTENVFTEEVVTEEVVTEEVVEQSTDVVTEQNQEDAESVKIRTALEEKNMSELRSYLSDVLKVDESEFSHFKGKDAKSGLVDFIIKKINN